MEENEGNKKLGLELARIARLAYIEFEAEEMIKKMKKQRKLEEQKKLEKKKKRKISKEKSMDNKKKYRVQGAIIGVIGTAILAGGSYGTYRRINKYNADNRHVTLEESIKNGNTYENLGITEEIAQEISDIKDEIKYMDKDNLDEEKLKKIADRLEYVQMYVIKSKVAKSLNENRDENSQEVTVDDLELRPATQNASAYILNKANITKVERYDNDFLSSEISSDIANEIEKLGEVQGVGSGNIDSLKKQYQILENAANSIDEYAGAKVIIDKKGKIKVVFTKAKDLLTEDLGKNIAKDNSEEEER